MYPDLSSRAVGTTARDLLFSRRGYSCPQPLLLPLGGTALQRCITAAISSFLSFRGPLAARNPYFTEVF